MKKIDKRKTEMFRKINIIKDFAKKMGYDYCISEYNNCDNGRPMICIEIIGTCDSEGNYYNWAWYTDTYEEY